MKLQDILYEDLNAPKKKWVTKNLSNLDQDVLDEIWDMFEHTYKSIGLVVSNLNELTSKYKIAMLVDIDKDPVPDAFIIYKETRSGNKIALAGTDGSKPAKSFLVKQMLLLLKKKGWFIEASHRLAEIFESSGVNIVDDKEKVERALNKDIKWLGKDGKYERKVGGSIKAVKQLFGNPR